MKRVSCLFLLLLLTACAGTGTVLAHNHHPIDTAVTIAPNASAATQDKMKQHETMESIDAFPNYHPLIVHFPIVLLLMAVLFQLLSFFVYKKEFSLTTLILLSLGVLTSWLASNTFHADPGPLPANVDAIFKVHEQMANYTWWFSLIALLIKIPSHFLLKERKWWIEGAVLLFLIASGVTVSIAGHHGAMLVHLNGIGPLGHHLDEEHGM